MTPWLLHDGLTPNAARGGLMVPLFAATLHGAGLPVPEGGAVAFLRAFTEVLDDAGVQVVTGTAVTSVLVDDGRAVGVVAGGRRLGAGRAVLASVTPAALLGELLPPTASSATVRADAAGYRTGRGAMQTHLALRTPLRWAEQRQQEVPLVHVTQGSSSTGIACAQALAGLLPANPTIVVGRQEVLGSDPGAGRRRSVVAATPGGPARSARGRGGPARYVRQLDAGTGRWICRKSARTY